MTRLVRGKPSARNEVLWDPERYLSPEAVSGFDAVVHLAGETIAARWTAKRKHEVLQSRIHGTRTLAEAMAKAPERPPVLVSASAIGFYGDRGDEVLREDSPAGNGFAAEVCRAWEAATGPAEYAGIRTVCVRFGLVLSQQGGALAKMLLPFRMGLGGRVGGGHQWCSWVHAQDVAGAVLHTINNELLKGAVNVVAPHPVRNAEFVKVLGDVLHRPAVLPVPAAVVKMVFGEMGRELMLASQRVEPVKLRATEYEFRFPDLRPALEDIVRA